MQIQPSALQLLNLQLTVKEFEKWAWKGETTAEEDLEHNLL
jgi:hypothetical protein